MRILRALQTNKILLVGIAVAVILYGLRTLTEHSSVTLPNTLQDLITLATSVLIESLPFVVLGIILSIIVQLWVPQRVVQTIIPSHPLLRRLVISCMGVLLPVCECGNVPLARGLLARGFSVGDSITFLLAAPILNPITLITTHQAFPNDPHILVARAVGALFIANMVGWIVSKHTSPDNLLQPTFLQVCKQEQQHDHTHKNALQAATIFGRETRAIMPALIIGALLAGFVQTVIPREVLISIGSNPTWSILIMMLLAAIISICSNVDAFYALAFSNTFTTGSIVSFLVFGPMIDIKMLALMRTTFTTRLLVHVSVLVALMSMCIGLVVQYAF